MRFFKQKKQTQQTNRGFTLVEMAVVTAIFAILTVIVTVRYGDFTSNMLVTNMAYEVALEILQAQVFGLGSRGYDNPTGDTEFNRPYGVFINLDDTTNQADRVYFFADIIGTANGECNASGGTGICSCLNDECINQRPLQRNIRITDVRTNAKNTPDACEATTVDHLALTFKRPSPEAYIERQGQSVNAEGYVFAQIKVEAPGSGVKPSYVLVRKTGQISVSGDDICTIENTP